MVTRVQNGVTWTQSFDAENRLVSVSDGTTTTTYVYDGEGNRIKRGVGNTTTVYVAGMEIVQVSGTETQRTVHHPQCSLLIARYSLLTSPCPWSAPRPA